MGEAAEAILDGDCCQICGEFFLDDESHGYPRSCSGCESGHRANQPTGKSARKKRQKKRQSARKVERLVETAKSGDLDTWKKCSIYHYQKTINGVLVNWWPSSMKCMFDGAVHAPVSNEKDILKLIEKLRK